MAILFVPAKVSPMRLSSVVPKPRSWMTVLLSISVFIYIVLLLMPEFRQSSGRLVGNPAPPLHMELPGLGPVDLSEFRGQAVLINFWAEWCGPCLEEMPSLKVLEQKLDPKAFMLIAVNVDGEKARGTVEALGAQLPKNTVLTFREKELDAYGVRALPFSVLVDADGIVRKSYLGSRDWARSQLVEEIRQILPKKP